MNLDRFKVKSWCYFYF